VRGHVYQRGSTWYFKFRGPADPVTGKRAWVSKGGFRSEREAWRACRDVMSEVDKDRFVKASRRTLAAFLLDEWLPAIESSVKPTTWDNWRAFAESYVAPLIGDVRLQQITPPQLMAFYGRLLAEGRLKVDKNVEMHAVWSARVRLGEEPTPRQLVEVCGVTIHAARAAMRRFKAGRLPRPLSPGLAPKTVRNVHVMLHRALADAVNGRYLTENPASHARPPKVSRQRSAVWAPEQLSAFIQQARSDRFFALFLLATTTGMRRAELCGLRWTAVDLDAGLLSVQESRVVVAGRAQGSDGKTHSAGRMIALDAGTIDALREWGRSQESERQIFDSTYPATGLVFTWQDGRPVHPDTVRERFARLAAAAGLPPIRFHDLRHSYATAALRAGVHPKIVSHRIGHASAAFTLNVYSHVTPGMDRAAAADVAALVLGKIVKPEFE
jgi:integrase